LKPGKYQLLANNIVDFVIKNGAGNPLNEIGRQTG